MIGGVIRGSNDPAYVRCQYEDHSGLRTRKSIYGDVEQLPFDDGSFDVGVAAWVHHVSQLDRASSELVRVVFVADTPL